MPTPLDRALQSKSALLGFAGIVGAVAAWSIWGSGGELFPREPDPTGDPEDWSEHDMRRWLEARGLLPSARSSREELLARVKANMRAPRTGGNQDNLDRPAPVQ